MSFTPESLLQLALDAQAELDATKPDVRSDLYWDVSRRRDDALHTAAWMEQHGITEAKSIGPYGNPQIRQGDKVRVLKGAKIGGTGNRVPERAGVTHTVTVVSIDPGHVFAEHGRIRLTNAKINWAGRGSYWRWTDVTNVELQ
jgi:hypothetical protein